MNRLWVSDSESASGSQPEPGGNKDSGSDSEPESGSQ